MLNSRQFPTTLLVSALKHFLTFSLVYVTLYPYFPLLLFLLRKEKGLNFEPKLELIAACSVVTDQKDRVPVRDSSVHSLTAPLDCWLRVTWRSRPHLSIIVRGGYRYFFKLRFPLFVVVEAALPWGCASVRRVSVLVLL
jgi:hypothetical protein